MEGAALPMVQQIEDLLRESRPSLAAVEDTLTQGYAEALALEAERLRIERRLGEVARTATADQAAEIRRLGTRLTSADGELRRLRTVLGTLQDRARALRAAAAHG
jgi:chromosome segregation ATPase